MPIIYRFPSYTHGYIKLERMLGLLSVTFPKLVYLELECHLAFGSNLQYLFVSPFGMIANKSFLIKNWTTSQINIPVHVELQVTLI